MKQPRSFTIDITLYEGFFVIVICERNIPNEATFYGECNFMGSWRNRLAQESYTFKVTGSSPVLPTNKGSF